jgi:ribosomal protein S18 acetylase RimI-like enzyme
MHRPITPPVQFEILDLRHFSANSLRAVLDQEVRVWNERLQWNYRASADLLLQYLDSRVLPGYVAMEDGRVSGYVFCVYEENKAVIGDAFAIPKRQGAHSANEIELRLLDHVIDLLINSPGIDRIESQLLLHPHGAHASVFERANFEIFPRLFMERDLTPSFAGLLNESEHSLASKPLPDDLELRGWHDEDFTPAGRLIARCYEGHLDSQINDQYRSVAGSLRFLHNVVRFPGCGNFDPLSSKVIARRGSKELAGILLCSRVRSDVAHITQICVDGKLRGLGLGTLLLKACASELRKRRCASLTLTVTEGNSEAVSLYQTQRFYTKHVFDAMVWNERKEAKTGL